MRNKIIKNLTKLFLKDYINKLDLIKNNKNILLKIIIYIIVFIITYASVYIISRYKNMGFPEIALKAYLLTISILLSIQLIIITSNIFYYSKDLEYIIYLPVKPIEILISKQFTIIVITYMTEIVLLPIPLFIYGILVSGSFIYFFNALIVLIVFPIFYSLIISILTLLTMRYLKKIKNENITQILSILILLIMFISLIFFILYSNINSIQSISNLEEISDIFNKINKYFIINNTLISLLIEKNIFKNFFNIIKILILNSMLFLIVCVIGKNIYYNSLISINKKNIIAKKRKYKYKKHKKEIAYFRNEIKKTVRNIIYFSQIVYTYITAIFIGLMFLHYMLPIIVNKLQTGNYNIDSIEIQAYCIVLIFIQIISTFNNFAITGISKEGREAVFMKYIPFSLYNQFCIKLILPIVLNSIMNISVLIVISNNIPKISIWYYIITFFTTLILNIIYNILLLLLDCKNPNLNWTNQESIIKSGHNKIYKYFLTIIFILIILYFSSIFETTNFIISVIIINLVLILFLVLLNVSIKKNIDKIFNKIY